MSETEIWKPVPRFDGLIEASNLGRVKINDRTINAKGSVGRSGYSFVRDGRILEGREHEFGYWLIEFMVEGVMHRTTAHKLVAEAWLGDPPEEGMHVCHGDNNPKNNHISNLRYDSPKGNASDKYVHGTQLAGEDIWWHKLKEEQVVEIRNRRAAGEKLADIGLDYDLPEIYVWQICTGKKWPYAPGPITGKTRKVKILNEEQKREVLEMRDTGMTIGKLAKHFDVSITQIHNLIKKHENR